MVTSLRWKIVALLSLVAVLLGASTYGIQQWIVLPGFRTVELNEAQQDMIRVHQAIHNDLNHLAAFTHDWSMWDDAYHFIIDLNKPFEESNLRGGTTFISGKVNLILFLRLDGSVAWGETHDTKTGQVMPIVGLIESLSGPNHPFASIRTPSDHVTGLIPTALGPMLVSGQPLVTSDNQGPLHGYLVMGRLLDNAAFTALSDQLCLKLTMHPVTSCDHPGIQQARDRMNMQSNILIQENDADHLFGYALMHDVRNQPLVLIEAELPRNITQHGAQAASIATLGSIGGMLAILLALGGLLRRTVLEPLAQLTDHAIRVGHQVDLHTRLNMKRHDEIGLLADRFDLMVEQLARSREQMLDIARRAGKAEVANEVLHNVGNVVNGLNVSAAILQQKVRASEIPTLQQAVELLSQHQLNLAEFITQDPKGRQLPGFLQHLSTALTLEQKQMLTEMEALTASVEHIKQVIQSQKPNGGVSTFAQYAQPAQVGELALQIVQEQCAQAGIRVTSRIQALPEARFDRHLTLQILVNLLKNAVEAIESTGRKDGEIILALQALTTAGRPYLEFVVTDNGKGFTPAQKARLFTFGFTTRPQGQGLGLHSAANAARTMGGQLTADSPGADLGATFTLQLPVTPEEPLCSTPSPLETCASS